LDVLQDRKWQPITATYTVRDLAGRTLALLWENYLYNIIRKGWYVKAPDGTTPYVAKEDSIILSLLRRLLGTLFGLLRTNFIIVRDTSGGGTDRRVDFERGMRTAPPLSLLLIAANVALFGWELAAGALASRESIVEAGALVRDRVLAGEWWRLESATFLHAGWDHLIGNCLVLYVVGMACEHAFGFARTAVVYFTSGLTGSLLSTTLSPGPSVGASGAIFGLVAAVIVVLYRHQQRFYLRYKR